MSWQIQIFTDRPWISSPTASKDAQDDTMVGGVSQVSQNRRESRTQSDSEDGGGKGVTGADNSQ